jgi:Rap1a immunity proteins
VGRCRSVGLALMVGAAASLAQPAAAQQTSVDLQRMCGATKANVDALICQVYFNAFTETLIASGAAQQNGICLPPGASANQNRLVVQKYMADHPEKLHEYAAILILDALSQAFPCTKNQVADPKP